MYSAWLPWVWIPVPTAFAQNMGLPRRHHSQRPHPACTHGTPTRSPFFRVATALPTATISPTGSWPRTCGNFTPRAPLAMWTSV